MRTLLLLFAVTLTLSATTLTGTLNYPNATGMSGTLIMSLSQQAALSSSGGCGGPIEVVPTYQYRITVTAGSLTGSPHVYGNDCMLPQGTYYSVQLLDTNANILFTDRWVIVGSSIDVGTIISATIQGTTQTLGQTGVIVSNPASNQTVTQATGTNLNVNLLNVTTMLTMPNGAQCTSSGCTGFVSNAVTTDATAQTIIGPKTFLATTTTFNGVTAQVGRITEATTTFLQLDLGTIDTPTDFHQLVNDDVGHISMYDSNGDTIGLWGDASGFDSNPLFAVPGGYVQGDAGVITNVHPGDFACSGFPDGMLTVRNDTSPIQLQVCYGGTVHRANLN